MSMIIQVFHSAPYFCHFWGPKISMILTPCSARKVAVLLAIGDQEFTFGELSMKAGCYLANKNYDF
jgi:hypothetical protein